MRNPTGGMPDKLAQSCGTEPIVLIEIQWVDGGQPILYADRKIADSVRGQIVEIGSIDSAVKVDGSTDSTQVQLILEDTDGKIKALCDAHDLHKRPVWVHQWFTGLDLADKMLLFKGEINSPFIWNEGDRTVSFDVTTKIEDVEAGFSMEEGDFPIVPPDALGKAWPLVFGTVCDVQAVQVRAPRYGTLQAGEGIHDYTLEPRICQARYIQCANVPLGESEQVTSDTPMVPNADSMLTVPETEIVQNWGPDQSCVEDRFFTICDLMHSLGQQLAYEHATMTIQDGGRLFPQNQQITLNISGGKFTGYFIGDTFTITSREHPDYAINPPTICRPVADRSFTKAAVLDQADWVQTQSGAAWYDASVYNGSSGGINLDPQDILNFCNKSTQTTSGWVSDGGPADSQKAFDDMVTSSFFWARAGTKVYVEGEAEVLYIVNLLPCTITRVAAMKTIRGVKRLVTVPADYYTIYETDYDGYTVTEIGMTKLLSERTEVVENPDGTKRMVSSNWSDDLYVTITSTVGPNPVDIITWLLGRYAPDLSVDSTSFAHVHDRLENYPSNFALLERENVMQLIADIATQSRCVVYVRDDTVFLKYVSEEPTLLNGGLTTITITESDVLANTLKLSLSNTDDVATKHVVTWSRSQSEGELKVILKHNVAKYGTHAKELSYYTQNIYDNILKSATFWMIRDANVWKIAEFSTPLKYLALEVFDCILLDLSDIGGPVKAIVTSMRYDPANEQIDFICWTPLRAGETEPYIHAWPADIPAGTIFPTAKERLAGLGYEFTVRPPEGHLLYVEAEDDGQPKLVLTSGDPHPSDLDDTLGTCFCPTTDDAIVDEPDPVFTALKKAQKANRDAQQNQMNSGVGNVNDQNKKKKGQCDCQTDSVESCNCIVEVMFCTADLVGIGCSGPCSKFSHGLICTGHLDTWCYTVGSAGAAATMRTQIAYEVAMNLCNWIHGERGPYLPPIVRCCGDCGPIPGETPFEGQIKAPAIKVE